jgi:hypothetical protein
MPPEIIGILAICATVAIVALSRIFSRHWEVKAERRQRLPENDVVDRLHRIEMAVEATAVEVERISEANRFMAKLLAERAGLGVPTSRPPERVTTPH